jgi:F420-non-reducing hydrogenase iron-sulfur subunit
LSDFEPKVVGFLCNWCTYSGADLTGVSRIQYPPNLRVVRVMCSGRIDPSIVMEMFIHGYDGVFIGGCHLGDCHYEKGNYHAEKKALIVKKLLEKAGIEPERFRLEWISASESQKFADTVKEVVETIKGLGRNPVYTNGRDLELLMKLYVARNVAKDFRLRVVVGREVDLLDEGDAFQRPVSEDKLHEFYDRIIDMEFMRQQILLTTIEEPMSVKDIAKKIDEPPYIVLRHITTLLDRGLVSMVGKRDQSPLYHTSREVFA